MSVVLHTYHATQFLPAFHSSHLSSIASSKLREHGANSRNRSWEDARWVAQHYWEAYSFWGTDASISFLHNMFLPMEMRYLVVVSLRLRATPTASLNQVD
jgi:hypothetical protein